MNPIHSMTAFASLQAETPQAHINWEIRSVNHRYLEINIKLPETLRAMEPDIRQQIKSLLGRGKIECTLHLRQLKDAQRPWSINQPLVQQIHQAADSLASTLQNPALINPLELLKWPGVIEEPALDTAPLQSSALTLLNDTLKQLKQARQREGQALSQHLLTRCDHIATAVTQVKQKIPLVLEANQQRLSSRLKELKTELDEQRLAQEMLILTQKMDVEEEMDRLDTHLIEVRNTLKQGGIIGRRLDFLMQELNREANTLSSKSIDAAMTNLAVEMKVNIEQMREQVQNLE